MPMAQEQGTGLGEVLKLIFHLLKWQFWIIKQIVYGLGWAYIFVAERAERSSSPPVTDFSIHPDSWFAHCHIVAGSGHGKTQLLQMMLAGEIDKLNRDGASLIVIDS